MRKRFLKAYAHWICLNPVKIIVIFCMLAIASLVGSILFLKTKTGILDLYSEKNPSAKQFIRYTEQFGAAETLIVVFENGSEIQRQEAMEALALRLKVDPHHYIEQIFYKVNLNLFKEHALQFLDEKQAEAMLQQTRDPHGGIRALFEARDLNNFFAYLNHSLEAGLRKGGKPTEEQARGLADLLNPLLLFRDFLEGEDLSPEAITSRLNASREENPIVDELGYLRTDDKKMHVMMIRPEDRRQDFKSATKLVKWTREEIAQVKRAFPSLTIGLTGGPALNNDQFEISKRDMTLASIFAYVSTGILFILAFKSFARPFLGLLTMALSLMCVFGLVTLTIGYLNMFSMAFIVILVGQGTYYGVHVVARYEEELAKRRPVPQAIEAMVVNVSGNVSTSAITTAAAFFATMLVPLQGFAQLGWIAGMGVLVSCLGMLSLLPALLCLYDRNRPPEALVRKQLSQATHAFRDRFIALARRGFQNHAWSVILLVVMLAGWGAYRFFSPKYGIAFDNNLLNLQAKNTEAVQYEKKLIETSLSPRAGIFMPKNQDAALNTANLARKLPTVQRVEWLGSLLPSAGANSKIYQQLRQAILHLPQARLEQPSISVLRAELERLKANLEIIQNQALNAPQGEKILESSDQALVALGQILKKFPSPEKSSTKLIEDQLILPQVMEFQERFFSSIRQLLKTAAQAKPLELSQLPPEMVDRFLSPQGVYAIYAYPRVNIWEREPLEAFVKDLRRVDPEVTGPPVMFYEILSLVRHSYFRAAALSALAIMIIFLLDFRSLRYTVLATIPLAIGVFSLFGLMSLFKIPFNTANMIALPMILGIGADNGVHMIHRFREEKESGIDFLFKSTGKALLITYLDSVTSFIGLAFASHQGLAMLGQVVIMGLTCCTVAGILFLPAVMEIMIRRKKIAPRKVLVDKKAEFPNNTSHPETLSKGGIHGLRNIPK